MGARYNGGNKSVLNFKLQKRENYARSIDNHTRGTLTFAFENVRFIANRC